MDGSSLLFGGYMVIKNKLTFGGLIAFAELMNIFLAQMHILPNAINNYRKTKAAVSRINEILLHTNEMSGDLNQSKDDYDYAVEFENVVFSYDTLMKPVQIWYGFLFYVERWGTPLLGISYIVALIILSSQQFLFNFVGALGLKIVTDSILKRLT